MPKKILILDDDRDILDVLEYLLTEDGYTIRALDNGDNIFQAVREFQPDLLLIDLMLAGLDGRSICKSIKEDPETWHIPVLMMSARPDLKLLRPGEGGPDEFIAKPFDINYLLNRVKRY